MATAGEQQARSRALLPGEMSLPRLTDVGLPQAEGSSGGKR
jgi:hypothetical protein